MIIEFSINILMEHQKFYILNFEVFKKYNNRKNLLHKTKYLLDKENKKLFRVDDFYIGYLILNINVDFEKLKSFIMNSPVYYNVDETNKSYDAEKKWIEISKIFKLKLNKSNNVLLNGKYININEDLVIKKKIMPKFYLSEAIKMMEKNVFYFLYSTDGFININIL